MTVLTAERLREVLSYNKDTGEFIWIVAHSRRNRKGDVAGCENYIRYWVIRVDGRNYLAHRLAWLYVTGKWPAADIDHINGNRSDNRWCNLREANQSQNNMNSGTPIHNTSGLKGVHLHKQTGKWRAQIQRNGKNIHLGLFNYIEEAHSVYVSASKKYFGEFARSE